MKPALLILVTGAAAAVAVLVPTAALAGAPVLRNGPGPVHYTVQRQPAAGSCHYRHTKAGQPLPDRRCTPGLLNPKVTQSTIRSTICVSGYTARIRPSSSVTGKEKRADAMSYGYHGSLSVAEYDHLVPLELGGDPNASKNLWVEPPSPGHRASQGVNNPKDTVENEARSLVCSGKVKLAPMQRDIAYNWTTALSAVGHPSGR